MSGEGVFLLRYRYLNGDAQAGMPLWCVADAADRRVGWLASGTEISYWATADGRDPRVLPLQDRFKADLTTARRRWTGSDVLRLMFRDRPYQVLHFWTAGAFTEWYINFETPGVWKGNVIESRDWHLDLRITADGRASWKDEDEAAVAVAQGHLAPHELALARDTGNAILADVDRWLTSIGDWRGFVPRRGWRPLPLPATWQSDAG